MKKLFLYLFLFIFTISCTVQRPIVDDDVYSHSTSKEFKKPNNLDQDYIDVQTTKIVEKTYYDEYTDYQSGNQQYEDNLNINIVYYPNYSYFINPYTYWYVSPYYSWYYPPYFGFGYYPYYWGFNSYWYGWNYHYNDYWYHNNWYYNNVYYGPRKSFNHTGNRNYYQKQSSGRTAQHPKFNRSQSYSSPLYKQPKSSREYINRSIVTPNNERTKYSEPNTRTNSNYSTSPRNTRSNYSNPNGNQNVDPRSNYNTTPRSNPSYSSPSPRSNPSYSNPSPRSNPVYSAPRNSPSPNYSAPRSSPSPNSSPSRSGGSGGRR